MSDLVDKVALAIEASHDKDAWSPYDRIGHETALECARAAILAVLDGIAQPSEAQMDAANALPVTEQINSIMAMTAMRSGSHSILPPRPNSPLEQWYRAMVAALRKEIANV